jgi:hypothetical protein
MNKTNYNPGEKHKVAFYQQQKMHNGDTCNNTRGRKKRAQEELIFRKVTRRKEKCKSGHF